MAHEGCILPPHGIVAKNKVDLHAGHSPRLGQRKGLLNLSRDRFRVQSNPYLHVLFRGIPHQFRHVHIAAHFKDVSA
jgi:hypothetical protein